MRQIVTASKCYFLSHHSLKVSISKLRYHIKAAFVHYKNDNPVWFLNQHNFTCVSAQYVPIQSICFIVQFPGRLVMKGTLVTCSVPCLGTGPLLKSIQGLNLHWTFKPRLNFANSSKLFYLSYQSRRQKLKQIKKGDKKNVLKNWFFKTKIIYRSWFWCIKNEF